MGKWGKLFLTILILVINFFHFKVNSLRCWKCNKQKCDEIYEDDCDLDSCMMAKGFNTTSGEEIQIKACKSKVDIAEFCKTVKGSCVSCSEDLCNEGGTKCYYSTARSIALETTCFNISYRCFSAIDFKDETNIIRGCVDKDKVTAMCKSYTKDGFDCSSCEGDFCNTGRFGRETRSNLMCYRCDGWCFEAKNETCPADDDYSCLSVSHIKPDDSKIKRCILKKEIEATCNQYKKSGSTCTACDSNLCNTDRTTPPMKCYSRDFFTSSQQISIQDCSGHDDFRCSTRIWRQNKVIRVEYGCKSVRDNVTCSNNTDVQYDFTCYPCYSDLCNGPTQICYDCANINECKDPKVMPCAQSNVSTVAKFSCFAAKRTQDGQHEKVKSCILKTSIEAEQKKYIEKGFEFKVCDDGIVCNHDRSTDELQHCYYIIDEFPNGPQLREKTCREHTDFSCISTRKFENGKFKGFKDCVVKDLAARECREYEKEGYFCQTCNENQCNIISSVTKCYNCPNLNCEEDTCSPWGGNEYACFSIKGANGAYEKGCLKQYTDCVKPTSLIKQPVCDICFTDLCNPPGLNCYDCEPKVGDYCQGRKMSCFDKNFQCFMAESKDESIDAIFTHFPITNFTPHIEGKIDKIKGCIHKDKTVSHCEEYKKKGYSCSVCDTNLCNRNRTRPVIKCLVCDSQERNPKCDEPKIETCPDYDDFSCLSIQYNDNFTLPGTNVTFPGIPPILVQKKTCYPTYVIESKCKSYEHKTNVSCEACHTDLCNNEKKTDHRSSHLKNGSKAYRFSFSISTLVSGISLHQVLLHVFLL